MLTKTANEMIGRRAKVKSGSYEGVEGRIDQITLDKDRATVRLIASRAIVDIYVDSKDIDHCQCGEGDGCALCAEKASAEDLNDQLETQTPAKATEEAWNTIPRRYRLYRMTPAERAIFDAVQAVEAAGADPLLTGAVVLLMQARDKVGDYVDKQLSITND